MLSNSTNDWRLQLLTPPSAMWFVVTDFCSFSFAADTSILIALLFSPVVCVLTLFVRFKLSRTIAMSLISCAQLQTATMTCKPLLYYRPLWLNPEEMLRILAARFVNGAVLLLGLLFFGHNQHFKWRCRSGFSLGHLAAMQRRWIRGI